MAAYKMAAVKVIPPNDFPLGLIKSHMVVIHLFLMLGTEGAHKFGKGLMPHPIHSCPSHPAWKSHAPFIAICYLSDSTIFFHIILYMAQFSKKKIKFIEQKNVF
jgi:hypothetical protein